jgi:hypothetical protein
MLAMLLILAATIGSSSAQQIRLGSPPSWLGQDVMIGPDGTPLPKLLISIAAWLSENFDLPKTEVVPQVILAPQLRLAALRHRDLEADRQLLDSSRDQISSIVALYDNSSRTIYLREEWRGTPAELSVLVHEMVHHVQAVSNLKFECPQAREKVAYAAQGAWLAMFDLNLLDEFEINPMAVFVRSTCFF